MMRRFPVVIFIPFAGICSGFAVVRRTARSTGHSKLMVRPTMMTTEPTSRSEPPESPDKNKTVKSTDVGRMSKRNRLSYLTRRFLQSIRPSKRRSMEQEASLDDALQRNASPTMLQVDNTKGLISQVENATFVLRSDGQDTPLDGVSPSDALIQTGEMQEKIAPIEDMTVVHIDEPATTRHSRSAEYVDLSGTWRPIVTPEFKIEYDSYLANCSQSFLFRKVVVNGIAYQKEVIRQLNDGIDLEIIATNPAGNWNRTLTTSDNKQPINVTITDPDGDRVQIEAWWEGEDATRHKSILRGKPNVHGGVFETVRYLESDAVLVCESKFYPSPSSAGGFKYGHVVWKFQREP